MVNRALAELREQAGSVLRFLSGIGRIEIDDRRQRHTMEIRREPIGATEKLENGARWQEIRTSVIERDEQKQQVSGEEAQYWLASRTFGRENGSEEAETEEHELESAASSVPSVVSQK